MNPGLAIAFYLVLLCAASAAWQFGPRNTRKRPFRPMATAAAFIVIAAPSLLQLTIAPGMLAAMKRSGMATGIEEPWRIVTALLVQDGGWAGMAFNLAILVWIGVQAESAWGAGRWTVIALCSGIGVQAWGWLVQPVGAGNSVVVYGLAASLLVRAWTGPHLATRIASVLGLLAAAGLLVGGDLHGGAAAIGALAAVLLLRFRMPDQRATH